MRAAVAFLAIVAVAAAVDVPMSAPANHPDLIAEINNNPSSTWTAGANDRFEGMTFEEAKALMGVNTPVEKRMKLPLLKSGEPLDLPSDFDLRTNHTECPLIGKARDQSACGSCWAFGSTEAFNDRLCIAHGYKGELSAQDTASCCSGFECGFSMGCNGGQPSAAWNWFKNKGVVTGAGYDTIGSGSSCWPYQMEICAHHVAPTNGVPACPEQEYSTPACRTTCSEAKYGTSFNDDKHFAKSAYSVGSVQQAMEEIYTKGSMSVAFTVYQDFLTYKSGVYTHQSGQALGGHAVKFVGWGVEDGVDYWWVMNSWNKYWGDNGAFKIKRGTNECGIESDMSAGDV